MAARFAFLHVELLKGQEGYPYSIGVRPALCVELGVGGFLIDMTLAANISPNFSMLAEITGVPPKETQHQVKSAIMPPPPPQPIAL